MKNNRYYQIGKTRFFAVYAYDPDRGFKVTTEEAIIRRQYSGYPVEGEHILVVGFKTRRERERGMAYIRANQARMIRIPEIYQGLCAELRPYAIAAKRVTKHVSYPVKFTFVELYGRKFNTLMKNWVEHITNEPTAIGVEHEHSN